MPIYIYKINIMYLTLCSTIMHIPKYYHPVDNTENIFSYFRYTKPQTFADCVGDELPLGWEESYDHVIGRYYINHVIRKCQILLQFPAASIKYQSNFLNRINAIGRSQTRMEEHTGTDA